MHRKNKTNQNRIYGIWCYAGFLADPGGFGMYCPQIRRDYCIELLQKSHSLQRLATSNLKKKDFISLPSVTKFILVKLVNILFPIDSTYADLNVLYICSISKKQRQRMNSHHSSNRLDALAISRVCVCVFICVCVLFCASPCFTFTKLKSLTQGICHLEVFPQTYIIKTHREPKIWYISTTCIPEPSMYFLVPGLISC